MVLYVFRNGSVILILFAALVVASFWLMGNSPDDEGAGYAPESHFVTMNAADSSKVEAEGLYESLQMDMRDCYGQSDEPTASAYQDWQRFNTHPYRSKTHGERFVNKGLA